MNEEQPEEKKVKLTMNQRIWLLEYMEDGNQTRAALVAYYPNFPIHKEYKDLTPEEKKTYDAASVIGSQNLRKLRMPLGELMDEAGLTDVYLTLKLKENLNATKLYGKDAEEHMDGMARNKALEIALKGKGKLIDRIDHTSRGKSLAPKIVSQIKPRTIPSNKTK